MRDELTLKIAGQAGQGMQTIGYGLCSLFKKAGYNLFANQDYMSRVRGGNNFFQLRVSAKPVFTLRRSSDIVVALDSRSVTYYAGELKTPGVMILDRAKLGIKEQEPFFFDVPLSELATKHGGMEIFGNSVACGVIAGITDVPLSLLEEVLRQAFADKKPEIIAKNLECAAAGYNYARDNFRGEKLKVPSADLQNQMMIAGNEAIVLAAIRSGCKFYSGYPMTPSTGILDGMAHYASKFNIIAEQAEDEIAAINMAIGASYAGVRAMTGTSGGGFALMVEAVSLAAMTETPLVIVDAQRPAPATGFPTRTEQADLDYLIHAGHGEFARAVFSPGTPEEAFYLTGKAFDLAEKYQIPVMLMTDQHLAESLRNIGILDPGRIKVERHIISKADSPNIKDYKRYQFTDSGISPRAVPSWIADPVYADSDEHTEEGHITEDGQIRTRMVEKRLYKKMAGLLSEIEKPVAYNLEGAETVLLGFGSTWGVIRESCDNLKDKKIGAIHFPQVWPFPAAEISALLKGRLKIYTVENNASGQLARLLRRETGIAVTGSILKFDGRPFDLDGLAERLGKL